LQYVMMRRAEGLGLSMAVVGLFAKVVVVVASLPRRSCWHKFV
jgi:hypothetical protein